MIILTYIDRSTKMDKYIWLYNKEDLDTFIYNNHDTINVGRAFEVEYKNEIDLYQE